MQRPHSGKYCFGKTPMQTFTDSLHLAKEKQLDKQYENMNTENPLTGVANKIHSDEISARPDDTLKIENQSSVHFSLENIEEDSKFVEPVNG